MSPGLPYFSVIVATHDRADLLPRCLNSVLHQDFPEFEVIVVDDGSTDDTQACLATFDDPRIYVLRYTRNRGVGAARNSGIELARGLWIIFLDSDDELMPRALSRMRVLTGVAPLDLDALWFRSRMDDGRLSPELVPDERRLDLAAYLSFMNRVRLPSRDMLSCIRRRSLSELRYSEQPLLETRFSLDFARRSLSRMHDDVLRLYHQDAPRRLSREQRWLDRCLPAVTRASEDPGFRAAAQEYAQLMEVYATTFKRYAPRLGRRYRRRAAVVALRAGMSGLAARHTFRLIARQPTARRYWRLLAAIAAMRLRQVWRRSLPTVVPHVH